MRADIPWIAGERVEAFDCHTRRWRSAEIERDAHYPRAKTGGAYVRWLPAPVETWQSIGGWVPTNWIRAISGIERRA